MQFVRQCNRLSWCGDEMLTAESISSERCPIGRRKLRSGMNEGRKKFIEMIDEIEITNEALVRIYGDASQPNSIVVDMERRMSESAAQLLEQRSKSDGACSARDEHFGSEKKTVASISELKHHPRLTPFSKGDDKHHYDRSWFVEFKKAQMGKIAQARTILETNLSRLRAIIKETEYSSNKLEEMLKETQEQLCEPNLEALLVEMESAMEIRKAQSSKYE
jgi:hypothetical protein